MKPSSVVAFCAKFLRLLFSSEAREQAAGVVEQMRRDGVDVTSQAQRREWIKRHRAVVSRAIPGMYSGAMPARNEHCPCGSRKKYKHCCGA